MAEQGLGGVGWRSPRGAWSRPGDEQNACMQPQYFGPFASAAGARGCLTCAHFRGSYYGRRLVCEQRARPRVIGRPELGCA